MMELNLSLALRFQTIALAIFHGLALPAHGINGLYLQNFRRKLSIVPVFQLSSNYSKDGRFG